MNIEDNIISLENSAERIINDADEKSKKIMASFENKSEEISREIGVKLKLEKEKIEKEYQEQLKIELDKIEKLEEDELLRIKEIAGKKSQKIHRKIMQQIIRV